MRVIMNTQNAETVVSEETLLAAFRRIEEAGGYEPSPPPILLHPNQYTDFKRRGWITEDGHLDWTKIGQAAAQFDGTVAP
jgi:hypothetical protein